MSRAREPSNGKTIRRQAFLEQGFEMFSKKSIEAVKLEEVAEASGHGIATLYRYFGSKSSFVAEVAAWKWGEFFRENRKRRPTPDFEGSTAAEMFEFYLDTFLQLYRNNRELLRFNQFLNIYIQSEEFEPNAADLYRGLMEPVAGYFHQMYERARQDRTVRTDVPEEEMLSVTIHLMLAVVTRYAVGLVYQPERGFDDIKELEIQKEMLLLKYTPS